MSKITLMCTVLAKESLTHDIVCLKLKLPLTAEFSFKPGQFAKLKVGDNECRSYAMANQPGEDALEFFVRKVQDGRVSNYIHEYLKVGDSIEVEGPFGASHARESHNGPILLVAGSAGLAPIFSIAKAMLNSGFKEKIILYFGVRTERDVYHSAELNDLAGKFPNFKHSIVVESSLKFRTGGKVRQAVLSDWPRFEGAWIAYVAGPAQMVENLAPALIARGIPEASVFTNPFLFSEPNPS